MQFEIGFTAYHAFLRVRDWNISSECQVEEQNLTKVKELLTVELCGALTMVDELLK